MKLNISKKGKIALIIVCVLVLLVVITLSVLLPLMYRGETMHLDSILSVVEKVETRDLDIQKNDDGFYQITNDETDKPFEILQLTDLHIANGKRTIEQDSNALSAIASVVTEAKPDLVVITGDLLYPILASSGTGNNMKAAQTIGTLMEKLGVPWVLTYGNHDSEFGFTHSKTDLSNYFESLEHCLFLRGPKDIYGQGNAYIELLNNDGTINQVLFLLDSNQYANGGYDKIHDNQVDWYEKIAVALKQKHGEYKSLMFFHIPLTAYKDGFAEFAASGYQGTENVSWNDDLDIFDGEQANHNWDPNKEPGYKSHLKYRRGEPECPPEKDGKMWGTILDLGVTQGIFVGHEHFNNYSIVYKGVTLTYGQSIDYFAYSSNIFNSGWQRGGTLITVNDDMSFNISPVLYKDVKNKIQIA